MTEQAMNPEATKIRSKPVTKNLVLWNRRPKLPDTHYIDTRVYTDPDLFKEEVDKIWNRVWLPICHESELPNPLDFRTSGVAGNKPIVVVRGPDNKIRTFLNMCPHRANIIVRAPAGNLGKAEPSGNAKHMTCMLHAWQFDAYGRCVDIPREQAGYQDRLCKADVSLREIKTEVAYGGFVWINLHDECDSLENYIAGTFDFMKEQLDSKPLEVFHYQKSVVKTNFKPWQEVSRELYHDYLHYHNRATGMTRNPKEYFSRKYVVFPNGHVRTTPVVVNYEGYDAAKDRGLTFPGLPKNGWKQLNIFPATTFSLRSSCLRVSLMTPINERETLIEHRGLGLKRDTPEEREERVVDHMTIWGPFGRNQHEDMLSVQNQCAAMQEGSGSKYLLMAREEDGTIHDEIGMRSYYEEWSRLMGRMASDPSRPIQD